MTSYSTLLSQYGSSNPKFEIKVASNGWQHYWVFKARNGEILCTSEMYNSKQSAEDGIKSLIKSIKENF